MSTKKNLGQIFTPQWIVKMMLDSVNFNGPEILNKTILEPSCGNGAFLSEIIKRVIAEAKKQELSNAQITNILENNITGIELDENIHQECIKNINSIIKEFNMSSIQWNVLNQDALKYTNNNKFDIVIGNPPYVRIHNLDIETRQYIKDNYTLNSGMVDLFMVFYELGINLLKDDGIMSFITPNSFLNTANAAKFRGLLAEQDTLKKIINFRSEKVFDVGTYTAILELTGSNVKNDLVEYHAREDGEVKKLNNIPQVHITSANWNFSSQENSTFLKSVSHGNKTVGTIAKVQYGIETLRNKIFVADLTMPQQEGIALFNGLPVEESILKPVVKGSTCVGQIPMSRIIWPYKKNNNDEIVPILEEEMKQNYPNAYNYFLHHQEELLKRNSDKGLPAWYLYGRSQGVKQLLQPKLVLKHSAKVDSDIKNHLGKNKK